MTAKRPTIAVTTSARGGWRSFLAQRFAIWRAGGRALRLTADRPYDLDAIDGLIVGGGDDISAELYGGAIVPDVKIDPDRDALEREILQDAFARRLPVLGICRGSQMVNVVRGGTLHQDIHKIYEEAPRLWTALPLKTVDIYEGTFLSSLLDCNRFRVNALHHQSIDRLGAGLAICGRDRSGIVQAVEDRSARFLVGVQWHPELLILSRRQQRLFAGLVAAARHRGDNAKC